MDGERYHDGKIAIREPVRWGDAREILEDPGSSSNAIVFEEIEPGQGMDVGRNDIGKNRHSRYGFFERKIRSGNQPCQQRTNEHCAGRYAQRS